MDICDAQFHIEAGAIDTTLAAMDAIGITSVLVDEWWIGASDLVSGELMPGFSVGEGARRAIAPTAELASVLHPDRFSCFVRLDRRDPGLEGYVRLLGESPFVRAVRVLATWSPEETEVFATGGYDELFAVASDVGMPVCLFIPGEVHHLPRYLERYPDLTFVIDHCGLVPVDRSRLAEGEAPPEAYFDQVLAVAEHPNVMLKWSHTQRHFDAPTYPYEPTRPYLRKAIEAFGADRLLWTSDASVMFGHTWSDLLHAVRDDPELSLDEKAWIMGRTFRRVFDWPAASTDV
jgi:L-fuconolactonase